ncbi:hypothetical protein ES319_A13G064100v1 [Gossypium barbadense]|uniref:Uncharacterized protein n=2 Tax=Gossypium TaxID=3633 RepID=A0A5J5SVM1_GOSBA|nr:hypothetical protein ES319_A13G064100v1 [Gossypium barbadense]TYG85569.1 hypothetical protein ES288_A13G065700v1 [Gossypium darwinii]
MIWNGLPFILAILIGQKQTYVKITLPLFETLWKCSCISNESEHNESEHTESS